VTDFLIYFNHSV